MSYIRQDPDILRFLTPADFIAKAYTDYAQSIAEEWSKFQSTFINLTTNQPNWYDDDLDNPPDSNSYEIKQWIANELIAAGYLYPCELEQANVNITDNTSTPHYYWSSIIQFGNGWLNIYDMIVEARSHIFDGYVNSANQSWLDQPVHMCDASGITNTLKSITVEQLSTDISSILNQATGLYAACKCSTIENVADRISVFNDTLSNTFSNVYDAGAEGLSYFRSIISSVGASTESILTTITDVIGVNDREEDTDIFSDTTIGQYTGVSPIPALDLNTAKGVVAAVGSVVVAGVKKCWSLLKKGFSWVCKKTKQYVINPIVNPYDLKKISDSEFYSIDKFSIPENLYDINLAGFKDSNNKEYPDSVKTKVAELISNAYFKCETIFGEFLVQFIPAPNESYPYNFQISYGIKPYCLNIDVLANAAKFPCFRYANVGLGEFTQVKSEFIHVTNSAMSIGVDDDTYMWPQDLPTSDTQQHAMNTLYIRKSDFQKFCQYLRLAPNLYVDITEDNEKQAFSGFIAALACIYCFLGDSYLMNREKFENNFKGPVYSFDNACVANIMDGLDNPTNKEWFRIATGWGEENGNVNIHQFGFTYMYKFILPVFIHSTSGRFTQWEYYPYLMWETQLIPNLIIYNQFDRVKTPLNYEFIPYQKNNSDFRPSRFAIKTDSEVIAEANVVANAIAVVSVVAVVVLTGITIVKTINRSLAKKRLAYKLSIEKAVANGQPVTLGQINKYKRANRKLNAAGYLGGNLQSNNTSTSLFGGEVYDDEMADSIVDIRNIIA